VQLGKIVPKNLAGFMELLPAKQIIFDSIVNIMKEVYSKHGFYSLDTPTLEYSSVLLAKAGGETEKQIYRFSKGATDMTMRFDLTVPLAKYVSMNYNELIFPFKRYQIGKVFRGEKAQKGRYREFYQADIDVIGDGSLSTINDAEITSIIYEIFKELGLYDFTIRINNRKILSGFFNILSLSDKCNDIMRVIDKIEKVGIEKAKDELMLLALSSTQINEIMDFVCIKGTTEEIIDKSNLYLNKDTDFDTGIAEIKEVLYYIDVFGVPKKNYTLDYSIARGLDYYTGTVYETTVNDFPKLGSVCSGGRYDNLAEYFTNRKLPGVGISIGINRLFDALQAMDNDIFMRNSPIDILLIPMNVEIFEKAICVSRDFQDAGIKTQIYFEDVKLAKKMKYANKINVPFVVILGENEISENKITIKRMEDGQSSMITLSEAVGIVKSYKRTVLY